MDEFDNGHYLTSIFESYEKDQLNIADYVAPPGRTAYGQFCDQVMTAAGHINHTQRGVTY